MQARDRSGSYVTERLANALPEPRTAGTLVPPAPVGISELVAEVFNQTADSKLIPLGVSLLAPAFLPVARSIGRSGVHSPVGRNTAPDTRDSRATNRCAVRSPGGQWHQARAAIQTM